MVLAILARIARKRGNGKIKKRKVGYVTTVEYFGLEFMVDCTSSDYTIVQCFHL